MAFERAAGYTSSFAPESGRSSSRVADNIRDICAGAVLVAAMLMATPHSARAGDFAFDWNGTHKWPAGSLGPNKFTMTDQYGFQLRARMTVARFGGTGLVGTPDNLLTFSGNTFGTEYSIWLVWDPNSGDRCDFVTLTGNAGNPTLSYVSGVASSRSVRIGPATGSGSTGALAANQAQCIYNIGTTGSISSDADNFGSILTTCPAGTHTATNACYESIENVYGVTSRDAAARGTGVWAATRATVNQSISLAKSTAATSYTTHGQTITYTYTVENTGNQAITNVFLNDAHGGSGPAPVPSNETLTTDAAPFGDSIDAGTNGTWDTIAPGDNVTFTATYTVIQNDLDTL